MGTKKPKIYLDNPLNTFYAGKTVKGRIEYFFDQPTKVRRIHVQFHGEAHTDVGDFNDDAYDEDQEYLQISYNLLGSDSGGKIVTLEGKQVYNFNCALPRKLPSSFEGDAGYVRYTIKVTLDRSWKSDQVIMVAFTVINPLDLNLDPSNKEPIHMQMEKTFYCLCCASPPLSVDVRAPVSGYCPGQVIPVQVDIENKSNIQLNLVKVSLMKMVKYRDKRRRIENEQEEYKDVVRIQEGPVPGGTTKHWELELEIPPITPTMTNCNLIKLDYYLSVECVFPSSCLHGGLGDSKKVTIGTVPLESGVS